MFFAANASKRSLALDFKDPEGMEALLRLVDSRRRLRPVDASRRRRSGSGSGARTLRARNEQLVYCSIGAFGRDGPLAGEPGYDPLMQAFTGIISITGEPDRPGVRVGTSLIDIGTGVVGRARHRRRAARAGARRAAGARSTSSLFETGALARRLPAHRRASDR